MSRASIARGNADPGDVAHCRPLLACPLAGGCPTGSSSQAPCEHAPALRSKARSSKSLNTPPARSNKH
uniref:Uncharacterized protein n=1 Tax=Arundo donax TaxID=35708 RepID=A0A0A8Z4T8_ARUDO